MSQPNRRERRARRPDPQRVALEQMMQSACGRFGTPRVWREQGSPDLWAQVMCSYPDCHLTRRKRWMSALDDRGSVEFALDLWANHLESWHETTCPWSTSPERGKALDAHKAAEAELFKSLGISDPRHA